MTTTPAGRPTFAAIDAAALRENFALVRRLVPAGVAVLTVVKADAYGHGARLVAPIFDEAGADGFGVATVEEGIELRAAGIRKPILVLAFAGPGDLDAVRAHALAVAVLHRDMARALAQGLAQGLASGPTPQPLSVHIKVDTGMGRIGVLPGELGALVDDLRGVRGCAIDGLFSHFANADSVAREYSDYQLKVFQQAIDTVAGLGVKPRWVHIANSAAVLSRPDTHFTMVRPGIVLYGVAPAAMPAMAPAAVPAAATGSSLPGLRAAMRLVSRIIQLKAVPSEFPISYGQTFVTRRPSLIATVPIGYADGYSRALSNRASVLIRSQRAPVVGTVCMDLTMVDVTDIPGVQLGDEVVLWGRQGQAEIGVSEVAAWQGTIAYELLTGVGKRVPRVLH